LRAKLHSRARLFKHRSMLSSWSAPFLLALCISSAVAIDQGPLKIDVDGRELDLHVVASSEKGKLFHTSNRTLNMRWGGETRGFLATKGSDEYEPGMFFNFTLLNKELSYDVDLSQVGCSCNAALFFVTMPGFSPNGSIARGVDQNPYYCDANKIGGVWCWETDSIEANQYNVATTPHTCDEGPGKYIDNCDRGACGGSSFLADTTGMCPDKSCKIDTRRPFRIQQSYEANKMGHLVRIFNTMTQEGRTFGYETCTDLEYLARMTPAFSYKMAMVFQLWGDTWENMQWLDKMTGCEGPCVAEDAAVSFSNIAITSLPGLSVGSEELIV